MPAPPYPIWDVNSWLPDTAESSGKKAKVWLLDPATSEHWLFRIPRTAAEAWAEKITEKIAERLGIPHARYELALYRGVVGTITHAFTNRTLTPEGAISLRPLYHGNTMLQGFDAGYEKDVIRSKQHHLPRIFRVLDFNRLGWFFHPPRGLNVPGIRTAGDAFVGFLMLDVLVANTDRHHENWGVQADRQLPPFPRFELAPTFDHASSLGRNLDDAERERWLAMPGGVDRFCRRGISKIFRPSGERLRVRDTFPVACDGRPGVGPAWQRHLASVPIGELLASVDAVPDALMSPSARRFSRSMLESSRRYLLSLSLP